MDTAGHDDSLPTRDILAAYLAGDGAAERKLFERHRARLLDRARGHRLMRFLRTRMTSDDVVDEVFLRSLASGFFREFRDGGPGSLDRALGGVLEHVLLDACRRLGARKRGANVTHESCDQIVDDSVAAATPTPTGEARLGEMIERCRQELEPREWEAWRLVEIEGLGISDVARRMRASDAAVRGLCFRARARLVKLLSRDDLM